MRWTIKEKLEDDFSRVKDYILSIKDCSREQLKDEIIRNIQELNETTWRKTAPAPWRDEEWIAASKNGLETETHIGLITRAVEEKFYICGDTDDHTWNTMVVDNIIKNKDYPNCFREEMSA